MMHLCGMGGLSSKKKMLFKAFMRNDPLEVRRVFRNYEAEADDITREERVLYKKATEIASYYGLLDILQVLLEDSFVKKYACAEESGALHYAAWRGNMHAVELLVAAGHSCLRRNSFEETVLYVAVARNDAALAELAINRGCDIDGRTRGYTPLHVAAGRGHPDVLRVLVREGADLDAASDATGATALSLALAQRHVTNVTYLVRAGARVDWPRLRVTRRACEQRGAISRVLDAEARGCRALAEICRRRIRRLVGARAVYKVALLPLPASLKDYVLLVDVLSVMYDDK